MNNEEKYFEKFKSVYLIYGNDRYLIDTGIRKLKERASKISDVNFNFNVFYAVDDGIKKVIHSAEAISLMPSRRFIVIKEAEKIKFQDIKIVEKYLNNPVELTTLIFVSNNIKKTSRLFKLIQEKGEVILKEIGSRSEYARRIRKEFREKGKSIEPEAVNYLMENVGEDLGTIINEIEKISLFFKEKSEIKQEDLEGFIGKTYNADFIAFLNAIDRRDIKGTLEYLENIVEKKSDVARIYSVFSDRIRSLFEIKIQAEELNYSSEKIAKDLKWNRYRVKKSIEASSKYSYKELKGALKTLFEAEYLLKTSNVDPKIVLEKVLVKIL